MPLLKIAVHPLLWLIFVWLSMMCWIVTFVQSKSHQFHCGSMAKTSENERSGYGTVYFVGAGPGAVGYLTLRGLECLQMAEVVLYDGLVNPRILDFAPPSCLRVCVGKHGVHRIWNQSEIDDAVVQYAKQSLTVVRLKGGDPSIFARTAEEVDRLLSESIPFEIVPGVTAAVAASACSGIPLTHRDWSSAVAFVTAHSQELDGGDKSEEQVDWDSLARFPGTLVLYMGVTSVSKWSRRLLEAGLSPATAIALIRKCSWPDQQIVRCTLGNVEEQLTPASSFRPPVLIIVGDVAKFYPRMDWFMHRRLSGKRILLTRPAEQNDLAIRRLESLGAEVLLHPAIRISRLVNNEIDEKLSTLAGQWDWYLFSSRYGVDYFFQRLWELGLDARQLAGSRIATVGPGTKKAIESWRVRCDVVPEREFNAEHLAALVAPQVAGQRCLVIRGDHGRDVLFDQLADAGAFVENLVLYQNNENRLISDELLQAMEAGLIDFTTVTSSSIARSLMASFGESLKHTRLISISPAVSRTLIEGGYEPEPESKMSTHILEAILESGSNLGESS